MKFEEVLPALREGKKIKRKCVPYGYYHIKNNHIVDENGKIYTFGVEADILQDDWEIVKKKKKIKLRDITEEQFRSWKMQNCHIKKCEDCLFNDVNCFTYNNSCWVKNKDRYNNKFLDQEIEIED